MNDKHGLNDKSFIIYVHINASLRVRILLSGQKLPYWGWFKCGSDIQTYKLMDDKDNPPIINV